MVISLSSIFLTGCGNDVATWTEDVRLHDDTVVTISRQATRVAFSTVENRGPVLGQSITYKNTTTWVGEKSKRPIVFDILNGNPFVISWSTREIPCDVKQQKFSLNYEELKNNKWVPVPESEVPFNALALNLKDSVWGNTASQDAKGHILESEGGKRLPKTMVSQTIAEFTDNETVHCT